ncbi:beta-phosphoglucomutase [Lentilactobacillus sp. SPB1-3]|uniref:Beta-phosphoglucomutase n=1 Tax=Lentilactobacillus terminaliae TaxID=3003483 RepID=A0ACD5DFS3_9LACO|nr:beta-phosphoglucomutase [Lentilactobacillus sp. SPB1-3]MCZ0976519.1 beta-phosphoglucomutase [Lentilactobacillus sp. SPB1-3]
MRDFKNIRGWCFDLHGVITDSWIYHAMAWEETAELLGVKWTPDIQEQLKGRDRLDSLEFILEAGGLQDKYSDEEKQAIAERKNQRYLKYLQKMNPNDILPGIQELLDDLTANGYKMIIASASQNAPLEIEKLGLTKYFSQVVDVTKLAHNKPAPDVFLKAAEMLDLSVDQCVGIDDGAIGVESINAAKMVSIGVGDKQILHEADIIVPTSNELTIQNVRQAFN